MKQILSLIIAICFLSSCAINQQAQQIKALEDCEYNITNVQKVFIAGTDLKGLLNQSNFNLANIPSLALAMFRKDVPLKADLNLQVTNPTAKTAGINEFEYLILINNTELAGGIINQAFTVGQGQSVVVPIQLSTNIYGLISTGNVLNDAIKAIQSGNSNQSLGLLTIKIKPTFNIAGTKIKYPGYITVNKDLSSKILL